MKLAVEGTINGIPVDIIVEEGKIICKDPVIRRYIEIIFDKYEGLEVIMNGRKNKHAYDIRSITSILSKELSTIEQFVKI